MSLSSKGLSLLERVVLLYEFHLGVLQKGCSIWGSILGPYSGPFVLGNCHSGLDEPFCVKRTSSSNLLAQCIQIGGPV